MRKESFRKTGCYLSKCICSIQKKPSSVPPPTAYVSPLRNKYWDVQTKNLKENMAGMNKDKILDAIYQLKHEDEEYHEGMIERLIHEYDDYSVSCEGDGTDSTVTDEFNKLLTESDLYVCLIDMENLDKSLQQGKIQSNILQLLKHQSQNLTLGKDFVNQKMDPLT